MKLIRTYFYLIIAILVWFIHLIILNQKINIHFFDNYLDDVLLIPIILGFALIIQRKVILKNENFEFNKSTIFICWLYFSIAFELIIPKFTSNFTSDWYDLLAYAVGALYFQKLINK